MLSSRLSGFSGSEGSPVQCVSPVRRYDRRRRRASRSSIVAPATASFSRVIAIVRGIQWLTSTESTALLTVDSTSAVWVEMQTNQTMYGAFLRNRQMQTFQK